MAGLDIHTVTCQRDTSDSSGANLNSYLTMTMEDHGEKGKAGRNYGCGTTDIVKHQVSELMIKAKEALQVKTKLKKRSPTEYCGLDIPKPATPSSVPVSYWVLRLINSFCMYKPLPGRV